MSLPSFVSWTFFVTLLQWSLKLCNYVFELSESVRVALELLLDALDVRGDMSSSSTIAKMRLKLLVVFAIQQDSFDELSILLFSPKLDTPYLGLVNGRTQ